MTSALILAVGIGGGALGRRLRTPGGPFLSAMLSTGAVSLALGTADPLPEPLRLTSLLLLGCYTGSTLDRRSLGRLASVLPIALASIAALVALGILLGWALHQVTAQEVSLATLLLGTMPGGASGLVAMAYDLGADARLVAGLHMLRQFIVFGLLPPLLQRLVGGTRNRKEHESQIRPSVES